MGFWSGSSKKKILCADDDENVLSLLEMALDGAGYEVDTAANGPAAVKALTSKNYDLAILDHNMPGMTGVQILEVITPSPHAKNTKFIMLTAESQVGVIDRAFSYKAAEYIVKPFDVAKLLMKVAAVLEKK
jgi:CheY-like chemotaxis protein